MNPGLILRYAAFAAIATLVNLGTQRVVLDWAGAGLLAAMATGTGLGLIVKYLLDKRWIFEDRSTGLQSHKRQFSRYAGTGVLTTLVFWAVEASFWGLFHTVAARETGALVGLGLGYVAKYALDRRFVFKTKPVEGVA